MDFIDDKLEILFIRPPKDTQIYRIHLFCWTLATAVRGVILSNIKQVLLCNLKLNVHRLCVLLITPEKQIIYLIHGILIYK